MPVQYAGVMHEHRAVRERAGLFDVSHMGEIELAGPDAAVFAQYLTTNDASTMTDGKAQYSLLVNETGTVVDDIIIYRFSPTRFIFVVNASNAQKDFDWIKRHHRGDVTITDRSDEFALIAFQGPKAAEVLQAVTPFDLVSIKTYHFAEGSVADVADCVIARTGYTGEDGFEIFCPPEGAMHIWNTLLDAGKPFGVEPVGLGARDTLRLEMRYSLYGHEITEETNPFEAGLGWVIKLDTPDDFIGKDALTKIKEQGPTRRLAGFRMCERAIPRQGYPIVSDGKKVGTVTSGTMSPSLGYAIGMGYVPRELAKPGAKFNIDIRGNLREAEVVKTPFYERL